MTFRRPALQGLRRVGIVLASMVALTVGLPGAPAAGSAPMEEAQTPTASAIPTYRFAGPNRYATSAAVAAMFGDQGTFDGAIFVASGTTFPDALAGGAAAGNNAGPLLLVPPTGSVPREVLVQVERLKPELLVVMGGRSAVSDEVVRQLRAVAPAAEVDRIDGRNRYDTAAQAADYSVRPNGLGDPYLPSVVLASGEGFPDALAGGALAVYRESPLLLTARDRLPDETADVITFWRPIRLTVLGGAGAVSTRIEQQVRDLVPGIIIDRLAGPDRYGTATAIANKTWSTSAQVYFANGDSFPDALSITPYLGARGEPLSLVKQSCVPATTLAFVRSAPRHMVYGVGGPSVVSDAALQLKPC